MANSFALTLKAQNVHPASTVIGSITQLIPDQSPRPTGLQSAVFEVTGTSASNTMAIGASGIVTTNLAAAGAVTQKDPITGSNLAFTNFRGLFISCDRADPDVAPGVAGSSSSNASTTSLAIGTGSKAFTVAGSLGYVAGQRVRAVSATGSGANWMEGTASYSGTTLTVTVDAIGGSSTYADWTIYAIPAGVILPSAISFSAFSLLISDQALSLFW